MILITGAMGKLGNAVVNHLQTRISKDDFILMTTDLNKAQTALAQGLNVREGNFDNPESLHEAFKGISKLLLISTMGMNRFEQHKNAIDAAKAAGVEHIVYTSLSIKNIETSHVKNIMGSHFETEDYLIDSGLDYTILRNTMYADALLDIVGDLNTIRHIALPGGSGKVPYALRQEMGEAAANVLIQEGHRHQIYNVSGDSFCSYADIAQILSAHHGEDVSYEDIDVHAYMQTLQTYGFPDFMVDFTLGTVLDIRDQQYEVEPTDLSFLLGRPSKKMCEIVKALTNG